MGPTLQLSNLLHHSAKFFRQFMSQTPPLVPGLFGHLDHEFETCVWSHTLHDCTSKLVCMELCKAKNNKRHEFLVLYFTHPNPMVTAHAAVVVDRTVENPSQSSAIASPGLSSQNVTEALDKAHVIGHRNNIKTYLSKTYGKYDTLCVLRYASSTDLVPSAPEISTLLLVVTNHRHNYNLYEYNCYWYAGTVFETCKSLFPGYEEECIKHEDRGKCRLNIPVLTTSRLPNIREEYSVEWTSFLERRSASQQELERKLEEERNARKAEQQALVGKLEEERRAYEEAQQAWEGKLEKERRAREEAQVAQQEAQRRYEQLQAELQAVRQTAQHGPVR